MLKGLLYLLSLEIRKLYVQHQLNEKVPPFLKRDKEKVRTTAQYSMILVDWREQRICKRKLSGRTMEIQRLIGRSSKNSYKYLDKLGE